MGTVKEPKNVDLSIKSEPWTDEELADFRKIMNDIKNQNSRQKELTSNPIAKKLSTA